MKKLILVLALVLALVLVASPVFATVTLTEINRNDTTKTVTVGYSWVTPGGFPRAFALNLVAAGGTINSITAAKTGESTATVPGYGIFPGTIDINDVNGAVISYGSPLAPTGDPLGVTLPSATAAVELGALYVNDANKPADSGNLFTVVCSSGTTSLTVSEEESYRGGVVDTTAAGLTVTTKVITFALPECYPSCKADYAQWVAVGKPSSWCNLRQCRGDASNSTEVYGKGTVWVGQNDLTILVSGWLGNTVLAADFSHSSEVYGKGTVRVGQNDLAILVANWLQNPAGTCLNCP